MKPWVVQLAGLWVLLFFVAAVEIGSTVLMPGPPAASAVSVSPGLTLPDLDQDEWPGCVSVEAWKAEHPGGGLEAIPGSFVVVTSGGDVVGMSTDETWERNPPEGPDHELADNVWPIGVCS